MPTRLLALALIALVLTGCSDDTPDIDSTTTISTDTDAAAALGAERDALAAELEAAEAQAEIDSLQSALDAVRDRGSSASAAPSASGSSAAPASSGSASATPGLRGLPPADGAPELFSGSKPFRFCETYRRSTVERFQGMEVCYEGTIRQQDGKLVGSGRKSTESGRSLTGAARTPIEIKGYAYGDYTVRFNYTVEGERRVTRGVTGFTGDDMTSGGEGYGWNGSFSTDAADSSGDAFFFVSNPVG